jgi:four helix bundle protein
MSIGSYADLEVWQKSMELVVTLYEVTARFPEREQFGLTAQLRRASVSIPCNIAEGQGRKSTPEFRRHLSIGLGSLNEVETCLRIAVRLGYLQAPQVEPLFAACAEIGRMANGLHKALSAPRRGN